MVNDVVIKFPINDGEISLELEFSGADVPFVPVGIEWSKGEIKGEIVAYSQQLRLTKDKLSNLAVVQGSNKYEIDLAVVNQFGVDVAKLNGFYLLLRGSINITSLSDDVREFFVKYWLSDKESLKSIFFEPKGLYLRGRINLFGEKDVVLRVPQDPNLDFTQNNVPLNNDSFWTLEAFDFSFTFSEKERQDLKNKGFDFDFDYTSTKFVKEIAEKFSEIDRKIAENLSSDNDAILDNIVCEPGDNCQVKIFKKEDKKLKWEAEELNTRIMIAGDETSETTFYPEKLIGNNEGKIFFTSGKYFQENSPDAEEAKNLLKLELSENSENKVNLVLPSQNNLLPLALPITSFTTDKDFSVKISNTELDSKDNNQNQNVINYRAWLCLDNGWLSLDVDKPTMQTPYADSNNSMLGVIQIDKLFRELNKKWKITKEASETLKIREKGIKIEEGKLTEILNKIEGLGWVLGKNTFLDKIQKIIEKALTPIPDDLESVSQIIFKYAQNLTPSADFIVQAEATGETSLKIGIDNTNNLTIEIYKPRFIVQTPKAWFNGKVLNSVQGTTEPLVLQSDEIPSLTSFSDSQATAFFDPQKRLNDLLGRAVFISTPQEFGITLGFNQNDSNFTLEFKQRTKESEQNTEKNFILWKLHDKLPLVQNFSLSPTGEKDKYLDANRGLIPHKIDKTINITFEQNSLPKIIDSTDKLQILENFKESHYFLPTLPGIEMTLEDTLENFTWSYRHSVPVLDESYAEVAETKEEKLQAFQPTKTFKKGFDPIRVVGTEAFQFNGDPDKRNHEISISGWLTNTKISATLISTNVTKLDPNLVIEIKEPSPTKSLTINSYGELESNETKDKNPIFFKVSEVKIEPLDEIKYSVVLDYNEGFQLVDNGQPLISSKTGDNILTLDGEGIVRLDSPLNVSYAEFTVSGFSNISRKTGTYKINGSHTKITLELLDVSQTNFEKLKPHDFHEENWSLHDGEGNWPILYGLPFYPIKLLDLTNNEAEIEGIWANDEFLLREPLESINKRHLTTITVDLSEVAVGSSEENLKLKGSLNWDFPFNSDKNELEVINLKSEINGIETFKNLELTLKTVVGLVKIKDLTGKLELKTKENSDPSIKVPYLNINGVVKDENKDILIFCSLPINVKETNRKIEIVIEWLKENEENKENYVLGFDYATNWYIKIKDTNSAFELKLNPPQKLSATTFAFQVAKSKNNFREGFLKAVPDYSDGIIIVEFSSNGGDLKIDKIVCQIKLELTDKNPNDVFKNENKANANSLPKHVGEILQHKQQLDYLIYVRHLQCSYEFYTLNYYLPTVSKTDSWVAWVTKITKDDHDDFQAHFVDKNGKKKNVGDIGKPICINAVGENEFFLISLLEKEYVLSLCEPRKEEIKKQIHNFGKYKQITGSSIHSSRLLIAEKNVLSILTFEPGFSAIKQLKTLTIFHKNISNKFSTNIAINIKNQTIPTLTQSIPIKHHPTNEISVLKEQTVFLIDSLDQENIIFFTEIGLYVFDESSNKIEFFEKMTPLSDNNVVFKKDEDIFLFNNKTSIKNISRYLLTKNKSELESTDFVVAATQTDTSIEGKNARISLFKSASLIVYLNFIFLNNQAYIIALTETSLILYDLYRKSATELKREKKELDAGELQSVRLYNNYVLIEKENVIYVYTIFANPQIYINQLSEANNNGIKKFLQRLLTDNRAVDFTFVKTTNLTNNKGIYNLLNKLVVDNNLLEKIKNGKTKFIWYSTEENLKIFNDLDNAEVQTINIGDHVEATASEIKLSYQASKVFSEDEKVYLDTPRLSNLKQRHFQHVEFNMKDFSTESPRTKLSCILENTKDGFDAKLTGKLLINNSLFNNINHRMGVYFYNAKVPFSIISEGKIEEEIFVGAVVEHSLQIGIDREYSWQTPQVVRFTNVKDITSIYDNLFSGISSGADNKLVLDLSGVFWLSYVNNVASRNTTESISNQRFGLSFKPIRMPSMTSNYEMLQLPAIFSQENTSTTATVKDEPLSYYTKGNQHQVLEPERILKALRTNSSTEVLHFDSTANANWLDNIFLHVTLTKEPLGKEPKPPVSPMTLFPEDNKLNLPTELSLRANTGKIIAGTVSRKYDLGKDPRHLTGTSVFTFPYLLTLEETPSPAGQSKQTIVSHHVQLIAFSEDKLKRLATETITQNSGVKDNETIKEWATSILESRGRHSTAFVIKDFTDIIPLPRTFDMAQEDLLYGIGSPVTKKGDDRTNKIDTRLRNPYKSFDGDNKDKLNILFSPSESKEKFFLFEAKPVDPSKVLVDKSAAATKFRLSLTHKDDKNGDKNVGKLRSAISKNQANLIIQSYDFINFECQENQYPKVNLSSVKNTPYSKKLLDQLKESDAHSVLPPLVDIVSWAARPGEMTRTFWSIDSVHLQNSMINVSSLTTSAGLRRPRAKAGKTESVSFEILKSQKVFLEEVTSEESQKLQDAHPGHFLSREILLTYVLRKENISDKPKGYLVTGTNVFTSEDSLEKADQNPAIIYKTTKLDPISKKEKPILEESYIYWYADIKSDNEKSLFSITEKIQGNDLKNEMFFFFISSEVIKGDDLNIIFTKKPSEKDPLSIEISKEESKGFIVMDKDYLPTLEGKLYKSDFNKLYQFYQDNVGKEAQNTANLFLTLGCYKKSEKISENASVITYKPEGSLASIRISILSSSSQLLAPPMNISVLASPTEQKIELVGYGRLNNNAFSAITPNLNDTDIIFSRTSTLNVFHRVSSGYKYEDGHYHIVVYGPSGEVIPFKKAIEN